MGVLPLTICVLFCFFIVVVLYSHRRSQAENCILEDGEEMVHHPTMAGRIFRIVTTQSHCKYVVIESFNVSGSRDSRYGMPTMHAGPGYAYQMIPPSVRFDFS